MELMAVTYLRTCLIGFQKKFSGDKDADDCIKSLEEHGHSEGVILEVGKLE